MPEPAAARRLPAPALRRPAAAGDDRDGAGLRARLLIADEPTTALDVTIQRQIMELLAGLKGRRRMSMLFISHDLGVVGEIADRVVVMRDGTVREQGAVADIFERPRDATPARCSPAGRACGSTARN